MIVEDDCSNNSPPRKTLVETGQGADLKSSSLYFNTLSTGLCERILAAYALAQLMFY